MFNQHFESDNMTEYMSEKKEYTHFLKCYVRNIELYQPVRFIW